MAKPWVQFGVIFSGLENHFDQIYLDNIFSLAFDPTDVGFPHPTKDGKPRQVQKGDAKFVAVFHTSGSSPKNFIADVNIILNDGKIQPGCSDSASHYAALYLRSFIIEMSDVLPRNANGIPVAKGGPNKTDEMPISLTNPPIGKNGIYYIKTGAIF